MEGKVLCGFLLVLLAAPAHAVFGDIYAWGRGTEGQLGLDNLDQQDRPMPISALQGKATKLINAGKLSSTAVTGDGQIMVWGKGITSDGILDPTGNDFTKVPTMVQGFDGITVVQFTAGNCHYAALDNHGQVFTWGCNKRGALGRGRMCADCHSSVPQVIPALKGRNVRQIVSGGDHTAALTDNGEVWVWGSGEQGEIGNGMFKDFAEPVRVANLGHARICQICAGYDHMGAVDTQGHLYTWGSNEFGQLGHGMNFMRLAEPTIVNRFQYPDTAAVVSCGMSYSGVITASNKVFMWGAGGDALPSEKTFFSDPSIYPRALTAGQSHVVVVTKDHKVYTWGANYQGQLGIGEDRIFTLEPQLVEDLLGKKINSVAAGQNHTIALAGRPMPFMCPFFQDWYGSPTSIFREFVAECHVDDQTCPDKSCCPKGQSCVQFKDSKWGCCLGKDAKLCDDQTTCCPKGAVCNTKDMTCEKPVSYIQATQLFRDFEEGKLQPLSSSPGVALAKEFGTTTPPNDDGGVDEIVDSMAGTPLNIIGESADPTVASSSVVRAAEVAYKKNGMQAASDAAIKEYQQALGNLVKKQEEEERAKLAASGIAAEPNLGAMKDPATPAAAAPKDALDIPTTPEDVAVEEKLRAEIVASITKSHGSATDAKSDVATMTRYQLIQELRKYDMTRRQSGLPETFSDEVLGLMTTEEFRNQVMHIRMQAPKISQSQGMHMNEEGVVEAGPNTDAFDREEREIAKHAPSIEDLDDDESPTPVPIPAMPVDPTQTKAWKDNVRKSEKLAGTVKHSNLQRMGVLAPAPAPETEGGIAGASFSFQGSSSPTIETVSQIQNAAMQVNVRPGSGPCPRGAGNLDCNRDCAEVDAKVIDAARQANELAERVAELAANSAGAGVHEVVEVREEEIASPQDLVSPSPAPSLSPSPSPLSIQITNTSAILRQAHAVVHIGNVVVHVPPSGYYKDLNNNQTYKIDGDKVLSATPAAKFSSMAGSPGTTYRGHCGVSRPTCPDNSCCDQGETCCQQQDGSFGCCPFAGGSCCVDQRHCCPSQYTCDLRNQACTFNGTSIGMARFAKVDQGLCPANSRACKDGSCCELPGSCCQMFDGLQGCAPFADATCCSDGVHACPDGSTCDTVHGVCVDVATGLASRIVTLQHSSVPPGVEMVCFPDEITCSGGSCCTAENTCCADQDGFESCCPFTDGVCCGNGACCPNGYSCGDGHVCKGPEGDAEMKPSQKGRLPFLVAEACMITEVSCPGTHECCQKGDGCCLALVTEHNKTEMVHTCCPHGEDAVCCEDATCCPFGHTCDGDSCVDPAGNRSPKAATKSARTTENPSTSTCVDAKHLQDKIKKIIEENAEAAVLNNTRALIAQEPTLQCPPYCGGEGSMVPTVDMGEWGSEDDTAHTLANPGEHGVGTGTSASNIELMEKERERAELADAIAELSQELRHFLQAANATVLLTVRGSLSFACEWTSDFRANHTSRIQGAISAATGVSTQQVILRSVRPGIFVDFSVDISPPTQEAAKHALELLGESLRSGQLGLDLVQRGFPEDCVQHAGVAEQPGVEKHEPLPLADQLKLLDKLESLVNSSTVQSDGSVDITAELAGDLNGLQDLTRDVQGMKNSLGTSEFDRVWATTDVVDRLQNLITLLLSFLSPVADEEHAAEALAVVYDRTHRALGGIYSLIKDARKAARCMRLDPSQAAEPGCEKTQMALANMPLRGAEELEDSSDPLLQRELGNLPTVPQGSEPDIEMDPPQSELVAHSRFVGTESEFWMPDQPCVGEDCAH